jgi:hypothetical protein
MSRNTRGYLPVQGDRGLFDRRSDRVPPQDRQSPAPEQIVSRGPVAQDQYRSEPPARHGGRRPGGVFRVSKVQF